jgi:exo-beta-1,3-glucanase (GH17 family)
MMNSCKIYRLLPLLGLLVILLGPGCNPASQTVDQDESVENNLPPVDFRQEESDLLAGVSRAICYSGFRSGQHPDRGDGAKNPSYEEVLEDLQLLSRDSNFTLIRIYDSGVNSKSVLDAIRDNGLDIKVMLGIWLDAEISTHRTCAWVTERVPDDVLASNRKRNEEEIQRGIQLARDYPQIIVAVNVGNEALVDWNDHKVAPESMIEYVKQVKAAIEQPVTVAENYKWWADHGKELAQIVDFVSIHSYPAWEGKNIDEGMSFTLENLAEVRRALPDARMVISEAGWATVASEFGSRASEANQKRYYNELMSWSADMNITTFFFEAFDEDWKGDPNNPLGAEKHWGIFTIDRKPKLVMQELYAD